MTAAAQLREQFTNATQARLRGQAVARELEEATAAAPEGRALAQAEAVAVRSGRELTRRLGGEEGWPMRLTDRAPFPDSVPAACTFEAAELEDGPAILRLAEAARRGLVR